MEFARTHKRLLIGILIIDLAATAYWLLVPFGENSWSSVVFHLAGYLIVEAFALNQPAAIVAIFLISYMELLLIAVIAQACWRRVRRISPL